MLTVPNDRNVEDEVKAAFHQWTAAWNDGNVEGYLDGYWESTDTRQVVSGGDGHHITRGIDAIRAKYRESTRKSKEKYGSMGTISLTSMDVRPIELDDAIVFGEFLFQFDCSNKSTGCFTIHLHRLGDAIGWQIVSEHTAS